MQDCLAHLDGHPLADRVEELHYRIVLWQAGNHQRRYGSKLFQPFEVQNMEQIFDLLAMYGDSIPSGRLVMVEIHRLLGRYEKAKTVLDIFRGLDQGQCSD